MSWRVQWPALMAAFALYAVALAATTAAARADVIFANNSVVTPGVAQLFALDASSNTVSQLASFS